MTDQPSAGDIAASNDTSELTIEEARHLLDASLNEPSPSDTNDAARAEMAQRASDEQELPVEGNADPEKDPGETEEAEAAEPPIERPKSWSKDEDAEWQSLPRAMQQKIVARESERDIGVTRSQQKAAEAAKAAEAKVAEAERARQQYEAQLPALKQAMLRAQAESFSDIKTWEDVKNLQRTDPFRYQEWDVHQKELAIVDAQTREAEARQAQDQQTKWAEHVQKENALAAELIPDLADKDKGKALRDRAAERLTELGFNQEELTALANGKEKLSLFDHRVQRLIFSDLQLSDIQNAPKAVAAKPLPPVQRPGISRPSGTEVSARIQALNSKPELSLKEAEELLNAQLSTQRRRAS